MQRTANITAQRRQLFRFEPKVSFKAHLLPATAIKMHPKWSKFSMKPSYFRSSLSIYRLMIKLRRVSAMINEKYTMTARYRKMLRTAELTSGYLKL